MLMIYLHTKFHIPRSSNSLVIAVKFKARENSFTTSMLLFYIPRQYLNKISIFLTICYNTFCIMFCENRQLVLKFKGEHTDSTA